MCIILFRCVSKSYNEELIQRVRLFYILAILAYSVALYVGKLKQFSVLFYFLCAVVIMCIPLCCVFTDTYSGKMSMDGQVVLDINPLFVHVIEIGVECHFL